MIAVIICLVSVVAFGQFGLYYWRATISGIAAQAVSDRIQAYDYCNHPVASSGLQFRLSPIRSNGRLVLTPYPSSTSGNSKLRHLGGQNCLVRLSRHGAPIVEGEIPTGNG